MMNKIKKFLLEQAKWIKSGQPYRTEEKIQEIFNLCKTCEHFLKNKKENEGNCGICGCRLTESKQYMSKNSWATTRCPLEEPKWVEEPEYQNIEVSEKEIKVVEQQPEKITAPKKHGGCGCGKR